MSMPACGWAIQRGMDLRLPTMARALLFVMGDILGRTGQLNPGQPYLGKRTGMSEMSVRKWCKTCGGHLLSEHPVWGVTDVAAAVIPTLSFKPALHVNYESTVLPMRDGLPKQKDFPAEMGGSGELLPE